MTEVAPLRPTVAVMPGDIRFGACLIKVAKREIYLDDRLQVVSRRAFDLLMQLVEHRDKVVTKMALSRSVWGGREVSDKLLAKIVVQIRQAIGDEASAPRWIKTTHGVGYRFIGELDLPARGPPAASADGADPRVRLALLPLENATGEPHFVWIELGLATLIGQAVATDPQIGVVPVATVLRALDGVPADATPEQRAATLATMVGAACVVQATLRREGELRLEYRAFGSLYRTLNGTLFGDDAVHLGERLAQRLARALSTEQALAVRFEHDDPFFNQLLSHATRFSTQRQWLTAIQFIEPALVLEPQSWLARMLLLRALVQCADARAFEVADELLADPQVQGDGRRQGMVHEALAALAIRRDFAVARQHLEQALRLSEPYGREDWAVRSRLTAALDAAWRGELTAALRHFDWLQKTHLANLDQVSLGLVDVNRASLYIQMGNLAAAQHALEDLLPRLELHGWDWLRMQALGELAYVHAASGRTTLAVQLFTRARSLSAATQDELLVGSFLDSVTPLLGDLHAVDDLDRLLGRWHRLGSSDQPLLRGIHSMVSGERDACAGDVAAAREAMQAAVALAVDMAYPYNIRAWMTRRLLLELRARDWTRVHEIRATVLQQPGAWQDDELQAWLLHAEAAELHADGNGPAALGRLVLAARRAKPGRAQAGSVLAAAWLQIEQGDRESARRSLATAAPWPSEHPVGIAVAARLAFSLREFDAAVGLQRRCLGLLRANPQPPLAELLEVYEAAASGRPDAEPPLLSCLVTLL